MSETSKHGPVGWVGATVSPAAMGTSTWREAADKFDARTRRPMAVTASRIYFNNVAPETFTLGLVRNMASAGVTAVLSFKPSRIHSPGEITSLRHSIQQCRDAGLKIESICLWHEPNDMAKHPPAFRTAQEYIDYVRYYGPAVVEMGIPLAYIPLVLTTSGNLQISYFPGTTWRGKPLVTHIYPDFYCVSQWIHGVRMDASIQLADKHGLRLGLGEFGRTNGRHVPTDGQFSAYMRYLRHVYASRSDRASCMYFTNGPANDPGAAEYAELGTFYDALTPPVVSAPGHSG